MTRSIGHDNFVYTSICEIFLCNMFQSLGKPKSLSTLLAWKRHRTAKHIKAAISYTICNRKRHVILDVFISIHNLFQYMKPVSFFM